MVYEKDNFLHFRYKGKYLPTSAPAYACECNMWDMATSTFGGLTRDVLCGRPIRIVHSNAEVYAPPALVGATIYLAAKRWGASPAMRIWISMGMCMGCRFVAIKNDVKVSYYLNFYECVSWTAI